MCSPACPNLRSGSSCRTGAGRSLSAASQRGEQTLIGRSSLACAHARISAAHAATPQIRFRAFAGVSFGTRLQECLPASSSMRLDSKVSHARTHPKRSIVPQRPAPEASQSRRAPGPPGFSIGGVAVSQKHANFLVNASGGATAAEMSALIAEVRREVQQRTGAPERARALRAEEAERSCWRSRCSFKDAAVSSRGN